MTLKKREKILAVAAGAMVLAVAGWFLLLGGDGRSRGALRAERDRLAAEVDEKETRMQAARRAATQLTDWQRRCLPADAANARTLYQNWLREVSSRAGFRQLNVDSGEGQSRRNTYTLFAFTVRGRAGLAQLTQFLYEFYSAGHLHQIRRLDVKPIENSGELDVHASIEAVSLPGAESKNRLSTERGNRLKSAALSEYAGVIVERNLFGPYMPARQRRSLDAAKYTFVTGIIGVDGRGQVWLVDRMAGRTLMLQEGESFDVGTMRGSVKTIGSRDVVMDFGGSERRLTYGDNLQGGAEGSPAKDGNPSSPQNGDRPPQSRDRWSRPDGQYSESPPKGRSRWQRRNRDRPRPADEKTPAATPPAG